MRKIFIAFYCIFLTVIALITIPVLLLLQEYLKLIIFLSILIFMVCLTVWLYSVVVSPAKSFDYSDEKITFLYDNHTETIGCGDISKIIVTSCRLIFLGEKTYTVTRIEKSFKQKDIDNRINTIRYQFNIPYEEKMFFIRRH